MADDKTPNYLTDDVSEADFETAWETWQRGGARPKRALLGGPEIEAHVRATRPELSGTQFDDEVWRIAKSPGTQRGIRAMMERDAEHKAKADEEKAAADETERQRQLSEHGKALQAARAQRERDEQLVAEHDKLQAQASVAQQQLDALGK